MTRKEAREQAFILVFEKSFRDESMEEIIKSALEDRLIESDEYVETAANGVFSRIEEIDELITSNLKGWKLDRVSRVALAAMRLSVFEIKFMPEIPDSVSVNEAVEITKKFATTEDSAYINGVLGSIIRGGEADKAPAESSENE